jgi:cytoskeleton protein RodZ
MNSTNPPNPEQAGKPPELLHDSAGMMLRKARENTNLTHAAVGEALHLTVHYIKALENDDYSKLPAATFVKGYYKAYARFLKLDANAVLASYERNSGTAEESNSRTVSLSRTQKRHDQTFRWAVVTAVIIVAGVAAGWWFVGKDQMPSRAVMTSQQLPTEPQASRNNLNSANSTVAGQSPVVQSATMSAPGLVTTSATPIAGTIRMSQEAEAVGSATAQTPPLVAINLQSAVDGRPPATGTTTVIDTTVTNFTSSAVVDAAAGGYPQPVENSSNGTESDSISAEAGPAFNSQVATGFPGTPELTAIPDQENVALTVTPTTDGARQITLISAGADIIQLHFKGSSWVEIDDGAKGRLYNETLNSGDAMTLHGTAPFKVLLGDAAQVELTYNSVPVNLAPQIRGDKTARFSLGIVAAPSTNTAASGVNP